MALSSSSYQDANGNWIYEVDGNVVDETTYKLNSTEQAQLENTLRSDGWTEDEITQLNGQIPFEDEFTRDQKGDWLTVDPQTGKPITYDNLQAKQDALNAAERIADDVAATQRIADDADDWRVRLHLAPSANYLYKSDNPGILAPLKETNGIIFPYTPEIAIQYNADYENYDLVHSNYRGYFYKGSQVQNILLTATFTANDIKEANYMLATMHFLRSATKMFYGQDQNRGMPPPVVFLTGLGEYQFNNHPCALTMFQYNLPTDVDYIPCGLAAGVAPQTLAKADLSSSPSDRLKGANLGPGGLPLVSGGNENNNFGYTEVYNKATYVPTKITLNFTMIPIQTRDQVSNEFSLQDYANGSLLKKGFW